MSPSSFSTKRYNSHLKQKHFINILFIILLLDVDLQLARKWKKTITK